MKDTFEKVFWGHPWLFVGYPLLFFYYHNQAQLSYGIIIQPLMIALAATSIIWLMARVMYHNWHKSALFTSLFALLFFSYGHVASLFDKVFIPVKAGVVIGPDKILFPLVAVLLLVAAIRMRRFEGVAIHKFIFVVALLLVTTQVVQIYLKEQGLNRSVASAEKSVVTGQDEAAFYPDIYYLILDAYARNDTLSSVYEFNNSEFTETLTDLGFAIADEATSNYAHTDFSLASSLNLTYINDLVTDPGEGPLDVSFAHSMIRQNQAASFLQQYGYQVINFGSGWGPTDEMTIADINYKNNKTFSLFGRYLSLNEFNLVFLQTTALSPFIQDMLADQARANVLYAFDKLTEMPYQRGRKFVIAHFTIPHSPYLFDEHGEPIPDQVLEMAGDAFEDQANYLKQLRFASARMTDTLQAIISKSTTAPLIILQSDHGPASLLGHPFKWERPPDIAGVKERMSILFAYHTPENEELYPPTITPVNVFRLLFNHYFNANYDTLPNYNYFSDNNRPFQFVDVTEDIVSGYGAL